MTLDAYIKKCHPIPSSEAYSEPSRTSAMELFFKSSERLKAVSYFCKKASSQMFYWVINTPVTLIFCFFTCVINLMNLIFSMPFINNIGKILTVLKKTFSKLHITDFSCIYSSALLLSEILLEQISCTATGPSLY